MLKEGWFSLSGEKKSEGAQRLKEKGDDFQWVLGEAIYRIKNRARKGEMATKRKRVMSSARGCFVKKPFIPMAFLL